MDRLSVLMEQAGKHLKAGSDPLNCTFLSEFDVTLDELHSLHDLLGDAIIGFARSSADSRMIDHLKASLDDAGERVRALTVFKISMMNRE